MLGKWQEAVPEAERGCQQEGQHVQAEELAEVEVSGGELEVVGPAGGGHVLHQPDGVLQRVLRLVLQYPRHPTGVLTVTVSRKWIHKDIN